MHTKVISLHYYIEWFKMLNSHIPNFLFFTIEKNVINSLCYFMNNNKCPLHNLMLYNKCIPNKWFRMKIN